MLIDQNQGNNSLTEELRLKMKDLVPLTKDLVCGMRVSPKTAAAALKYKNQTYYFCASGCKKEFKNNPNKYLKG
jgi:Cu+-exporting ATPase